MSHEMNINQTTVELSEQELEEMAGGISIFFSGSTFEKSDIFSAHRRKSSRRIFRGSSIFKSSHTFSSAFQVIGLDLNSPGDIMSFFSGLAALFGRR